MKGQVLIILFLFLSGFLHSQNTCPQYPVTPYDIIPNPSFELTNTLNCTSGYFDQFGLMVPGWTATTDEMLTGYLNRCTNFIVPDSTIVKGAPLTRYPYLFPIVPQPMPDGDGVVVVADFGYDGVINTYPKHKSYVNTCLPALLQKDSLYKLEFYVGFGDKNPDGFSKDGVSLLPELSPSPDHFSLFGLPNCPSGPLPIVGCPQVGGWIVLGTCFAEGSLGSWIKAKIDFIPPQDIRAIAIGPSCDTSFESDQGVFKFQGSVVHTTNYSYFLDDLHLFKANIILPHIKASGSPCDKSITLQLFPSFFYSGYNFQWYKNGNLLANEQNNSLEVNRDNYGPGIYQCRIVNDSVCLSSDTLTVNLLPIPQTNALGRADTTSCVGDTILLNAYIDSSAVYTWQDGSSLPYFAVTKAGKYTVNVSNQCGTAEATKTIGFQKCNYEIFIPNAFTPNGDGKNDFFRPHYEYSPTHFKMSIYNRYGQLLFSSSDPSIGWDGSIQGVQQPMDTYVWVISYTDKKNIPHAIRGTIELIR